MKPKLFLENTIIILRYKLSYYQDNKERILKQNKEYRIKNKDSISKQRKIYRENTNKPKEYYISHYNSIKIKHSEYTKLKYNQDSNYKIIHLSRIRINKVLKNNKKVNKTIKLFGCSIIELKTHLQKTAINNGYLYFNINNYSGKEYHIDHIIPCDAFNFECSYHQKLCFHYTNLQILSAKENLIKLNNIEI